MKKGIFALLALLAVFAMVSCSNPESPPTFIPQVTVTFESNGGTNVASVSVIPGGKISAPTAPTKSGFTFVTWYKEGELITPWIFDTDVVDKNTTLYAKWNNAPGYVNFTVSFQTYGGTVVYNQGVRSGNRITAPTTTNAGFTLDGWYKEATFTNKWDFNTDTVTGNITLHAKWEANAGTTSFVVTYYIIATSGNTVWDMAAVASGAKLNPPRIPASGGYEFAGWYKEQTLTTASKWDFDNDTVTATTNLYAGWKPVTYTVYFESNGGSAVEPKTGVEYNASITAPANPTKSGSTFIAWFTDQNFTTVWNFASDKVTGTTYLFAKWEAGTSTQPEGTARFKYADGTIKDIVVEFGATTWGDVIAQLDKSKDTPPANAIFGYWKDQVGKRWETATDIINSNLTLSAVFWSTLLNADSSAQEKVWLGNASFAIYKFTIPAGKSYADIASISADFKASEAQINTAGIRCIRPMGPYFYSDTPTVAPDGWNYYGDFAPDANGAYAAKFNSDASKKYADFNKFHPFLLNNVFNWGSAGWSGAANSVDGNGGSAPVGDTWFNVKVTTSGYSWDGGSNSPARVKTFIDADTSHTILPTGVDFNTVYFGFGIPRNENPHDADQGYQATVDGHGLTTLVKNVKIYFKDGSTADGSIPSFPARSQRITGGSGVVTPGTGTTSQVFASYIYSVQYNWRGAANTTVVPPKDITYTPPVVLPPADSDKTITDAASLKLSLYGQPGYVTLSTDNLTATVSLAAGQYGSSYGCGFWFALPNDIVEKKYTSVDVYYTGTKTSSVAKLTVKQGKESWADTAWSGRWKDIETGTGKVISIPVTGLNSDAFAASPAISFQINNNAADDVPQDWTFKIEKIVLVK